MRSLLATALLAVACLSCAHQPQAKPRPTFHYRAAAAAWPLGKPWRVTLDYADPTRWAASLRLDLPRPGVLKVSAQLIPDGPVSVLVFTGGKKPLVQARAPAPLVTQRLQGEVFVVVRIGRCPGPVAVQLVAELEPEVAQAAPGAPGKPGALAETCPPGEGPDAVPSLDSIKDLEFDAE